MTGNEFKSKRENLLEMTQAELAEVMGVSERQVSRWEQTGHGDIRPVNAMAMEFLVTSRLMELDI